jgi:hypothetical protein
MGKHVHGAALNVGARLRAILDADLCAALDELARISADCDSFVTPLPGGIGYGRRERAFFLPGPWRINLPGYYVEQSEDDSETTCLWFATEEIRGSSFSFTPKDPQQQEWGKGFAGQPDQAGKSCTFRLAGDARAAKDSDGFFTPLRNSRRRALRAKPTSCL